MKTIATSALAVASLIVASAQSVLAEDTACALSYETYEYAVPHTDMESCPTALSKEGQFCRLSVMAEVATVFVFSEDTSCLISAKAYEEDAFQVSFK